LDGLSRRGWKNEFVLVGQGLPTMALIWDTVALLALFGFHWSIDKVIFRGDYASLDFSECALFDVFSFLLVFPFFLKDTQIIWRTPDNGAASDRLSIMLEPVMRVGTSKSKLMRDAIQHHVQLIKLTNPHQEFGGQSLSFMAPSS
jgi:hypothetical protein